MWKPYILPEKYMSGKSGMIWYCFYKYRIRKAVPIQKLEEKSWSI